MTTKRLIIETDSMNDMLAIVDLVRNRIGVEIKFIEVTDK